MGTEITQELITNGTNDKWLNNIISLGKKMLTTNRDIEIDPYVISTRIQNRIGDVVLINLNKRYEAELSECKRHHAKREKVL